MKITPHSPSAINDTIASKKTSKVTSEEKSKEVKPSEDSININQSELAKSTKEINNNIGALQTAIINIDKMSKESKSLTKISKKLQNEDNPLKQDDFQKKADALKDEITKTFDASTFNGENVFAKNYGRLDADIKFDAGTIKPSLIQTDDVQTSQDFLKNLGIQKKHAKDAINLLNQKLDAAFEKLQKTDSSYDTLDKSALKEKEFKDTHKTEGITLERLAKLLG